MSQDALSGPDLDGVVADANAVGLDYVLDRIEATRLRDGKVLTGEDVAATHHLRVNSRHGIEAFHGELPIDPIPGLDS